VEALVPLHAAASAASAFDLDQWKAFIARSICIHGAELREGGSKTLLSRLSALDAM